MKKTKKALASFAIAGMTLSMIPFNAFANTAMPTRIAGNTAADTAVQIADQTGYTGAAILASSASYGMVDALTAGPLAASLKAPILLTGAGSSLDAATKAELTKLAVKTVYVTSGTAVISQGVLNELTGMGITVVPLGGYDRAETSVNIAKKMSGVTKVAVANGLQDALSIASVAAAANEPILLTDRDSLPASVSAYLAANSGITTTDVIGGTGVISDAVKAALPSATRHAGYTAYDTNNQVIQDFAAALQFDNVFVANGVTGIDALAGAPLAAQTKSPIVLTDGKSVPSVAAFTFSKSSASTVVTALGGEAVVPETVRTGVAAGQVTAQPGELSIVSVNALDDANQYLEIKFSAPVSGLQPSSITIANADTQERYGVQAVTMSPDGLTATAQLYGNDDTSKDQPVLEYLQDYNITVNANGKILTSVFNRSYSIKSRVLTIDPADQKFTIVSDKDGTDTSEGDQVTITVPDSVDFDYYGALGEQVQVWYNSDKELTSYKILTSNTKVDSIKVKDNDTFTLLGEDEDYDITTDQYDNNKDKFVFYLNGEKQGDTDSLAAHKGEKYNFAKVGFDASGDINFVSAYTLKDTMVFDSLDGDEAVGLDGSSGSFDTSDATIVKDGKVIDPSDLKKGDLVLYNEDADDDNGYAEVVTEPAATGSIDEVYDNSIEVGGKTYDYIYDNDVANDFDYEEGSAIYINDSGDVDQMDQDAAEELQAAGDVSLYTDPAGNLLYASGDTAEVDTNTKVAALTDDIVGYKNAKDKIDVEAVNQDGDEVSYDINLDSLDQIIVDNVKYDINNDSDSSDWDASLTGSASDYTGITLTKNGGGADPVSISFSDEGAAGQLVRLHLDDNGNLQKLEFYKDTAGASKQDLYGYRTFDNNGGTADSTKKLEAGDSYLDGYKLTSDTLLFDATDDGVNTDADNYTISKFSDYNGADITSGKFIYNDDQEVIAIWYGKTNSDDLNYEEAVVTSVLRNTDDEIVSISGWAAGEEKTFTVDKVDDNKDIQKGDVVLLEFDDNNDTLVQGIDTGYSDSNENYNENKSEFTNRLKGTNKTVKDVLSSSKTVEFTDGSSYKLASDGLVINASDVSDIKKKTLSDLDGLTNVTVFLDDTNGAFAKFFVYGKDSSTDTNTDTGVGGVVTYKNSTGTKFSIGTSTYTMDGNTTLYDANGNIADIGGSDVAADIYGNRVTDIEVSSGVVTSLRLVGTDDTLSSLKVNGVEVASLSDPSAVTATVPYSTTSNPKVTATATEKGAKVVITQPTAVEGTAKVVVTSEDGENTTTYTINISKAAASSDATLASVKIGGTTVSSFSSPYTYALPIGTTATPAVTATATDANATVVVTAATDVTSADDADRTTTIKVTAENGTVVTYTIVFNVQQ